MKSRVFKGKKKFISVDTGGKSDSMCMVSGEFKDGIMYIDKVKYAKRPKGTFR